jgi:hypothetical protein
MGGATDTFASSESPGPVPQPPRWRAVHKLGLVALVAVLSLLGVFYYFQTSGDHELESTIAELDRLDPGWRLHEILAQRRDVAPAANSAPVVLAARTLFGGSDYMVLDARIEVPPPVRLRDEVEKSLRNKLKPLTAAVAEARKLAKLPSGRFALAYTPDFLRTPLGDIQSDREVAGLLQVDLWLKAQDGDLQGAWISAQAMLNAGKAIGDEPTFVPQIVRIAIQSLVVCGLERILAQGEVPAALLAETRKELKDEAAEPLFRIGARGERAAMHQRLENAANGKVPLNAIAELAGNESAPSLGGFLAEQFPQRTVLESHVWLLRSLTRAVEASKLSATAQDRELKELEASAKNAPALAQLLLPWGNKARFPRGSIAAAAERREDTHLACAVAALAAEQFRLSHQRWPGSLQELVKAGLLNTLPIDLHDGRPLRFRRTTDGLVIYSVGADGGYQGKALDNLSAVDPVVVRVEFRLWDVERRRQPGQGVPVK